MAKQKITVESRLRTENTRLKSEVRDLRIVYSNQEKILREKNQEIAGRDAAIEELQFQLRQVKTKLGLVTEQCEDYRIAAAVNARLVAQFGEQNESLRYPPAERG